MTGLTREGVGRLTVALLRSELSARGESVSGRKADLQERLLASLDSASKSASATLSPGRVLGKGKGARGKKSSDGSTADKVATGKSQLSAKKAASKSSQPADKDDFEALVQAAFESMQGKAATRPEAPESNSKSGGVTEEESDTELPIEVA